MFIRKAQPNDLDEIAKLHTTSLPKEICDLTALGLKVLERFYRKVINENLGYLAVADENGVIGFCLITEDTKHLFTQTINRNPIVLAHTFFLSNKIDFIRITVKKLISKKLVTDKRPQLVYIAVNRSFKGKKIGQKLLEHVEQEFRQRNVKEYTLDVEDTNEKAKSFYSKNSFEVEKAYYLGQHKKLLLKKTLDS